MTIKSPITNSNNTRKIDSIHVGEIIDAYREIGVTEHIDKYFFEKTNIDIYECLDTGYCFYHPFDIFGDDKFYEYLQKQRRYYADWRWEHGVAFDEIKPGKKILEIGCGVGNFLKKIKEVKGCDCVGLELNQQALSEARGKGLIVYDQRIEEHAKNNEKKYDTVCFFQVLEHISDVKDFLESSIQCLKKGGLLVLGVPNNNPYLYKHDRLHALNLPPHHAGLWNKRSLESLGLFFDMELVEMRTEPLSDPDYFWNIQRRYWKNNKKVIYFFSSLIPGGLKKARNFILRKVCDGRNIIAIYKKK